MFSPVLNVALPLQGSIDPDQAAMLPMPIPEAWILEGKPITKGAVVSASRDKMARFIVWETTSGRFDWHYSYDEFVHICCGEAFITDQSTNFEFRLGPNDCCFFQAGTSVRWYVPDYVRKVAVAKSSLPYPLAKAYDLLRKIRGLGTKLISSPAEVSAGVTS